MSSLQVLRESLILLLLNIFIGSLFLWAWFLQNPVPAKIILGKMI